MNLLHQFAVFMLIQRLLKLTRFLIHRKLCINGNKCVNGKINVTVSVTENQELYDLEVGLKVEGEQDCLIKKNSSNLSAELEYNTYLIGGGKYKGNLLVIVKATDIAGNTLGQIGRAHV